MKCPHCSIHFHDDWQRGHFRRDNNDLFVRDGTKLSYWIYRSARCPSCDDVTIELAQLNAHGHIKGELRQVYPIGASRGPVPSEVPQDIAQDYIEACNVLPISTKASAALSRCCLQNMLHAHGYEAKDLAQEIDLLLNETDTTKALPHRLRETVDAIRKLRQFLGPSN
jgi:hypothetical protein